MSKAVADLRKMIDVNIPIICIEDFDYVRMDEIIMKALPHIDIHEWNPATGNTNFKTRETYGGGGNQTIEGFLHEYYTIECKQPYEAVLVIKGLHDALNEEKTCSLLALIAQRKLYDRSYDVTVILEADSITLPQELKHYATFLEIEFPSEEDIEKIIRKHVDVNGATFDEGSMQDLKFSLKGMSCFEIDRTLDMALSKNGTLGRDDMNMILGQKEQMVKKSGLLELIKTASMDMDSIGGMDALKEYIQRKSYIIKNASKAINCGVSIPKGIFLVGMPGCGKSLSAKVAAKVFEVPLLKMDMGSLMDKYVGESEKKLRRAIATAEAAAPCILWIDEIEKGFSGIGGKDGQQSDVMTRMFGYFLGWMQDKDSTVYVIATANNAENLPPELKRKGRFDEVFCVNLPTKEERKKIFEVHLKKKRQEKVISDSVLASLASKSEGFNGADIESVINEAMEEQFYAQKGNPSSIEILLTQETIEKIISNTVSISKSCKKQIDEMKNVFNNSSFKDATTGKLTNNGK